MSKNGYSKDIANYERYQKHKVRNETFDSLGSFLTSPARVFVTLSGPQALCVRQAKKTGFIEADTKVYSFEFRSERREQVEQSLAALGVNGSVIPNDLRDVSKWANRIEGQIDALNLDMEESFTLAFMKTLENIAPRIADRAVMAITLCDYMMGPPALAFNAAFKEFLKRKPRHMAAHAALSLTIAEQGRASGWQDRRSFATDYLTLLQYALRDFDVTLDFLTPYRDTSDMVTFVVHLTRTYPKDLPSSDDIAQFIVPNDRQACEVNGNGGEQTQQPSNDDEVSKHKITRDRNRVRQMLDELTRLMETGMDTTSSFVTLAHEMATVSENLVAACES